jgi:hypothetical protein
MNGDTRIYVTLGLGLKVNDIRFDFAYLAADRGGPGGLPVANSLRFGLTYGLK